MTDANDPTGYEPRPIDTTAVPLPPAVDRLLERLAEHNHDVWARQRIADGWRLGPRRDDDAKTHPCLIPYDELPESEKEYDRNTAREVLQALLALGWTLQEPSA